MTNVIQNFTNPTLIMKIGIGKEKGQIDYTGEYDLWDIPRENLKELFSFHIMMRIEEEMKRVKEIDKTDFYLFGTYAPFSSEYIRAQNPNQKEYDLKYIRYFFYI